MKVLIVDDSHVAYGNMSLLVERMGIEVLGNATTEKEIENSIKRHNPELVLMDTRCSYLSGTDTIRKIKKLSPATNIVAVSVFENQQAVKQVFASGISDIITKPVESERLIDSLRKLGLLNKVNENSNSRRLNDDEIASKDFDNGEAAPNSGLRELKKVITEDDLDNLMNNIKEVLPLETEQDAPIASTDVLDEAAGEAELLDEQAEAV